MSFIIFACFLWAFDALIRYPLINAGYSSFLIVLFEHFFAFIILISLYRKDFRGLFKKESVFSFFVVGTLGSGIATMTFTESFSLLNPTLVILLQKLQPIVAIILSGLVLKERIQKNFILWASVSLLGAILMGYEDFYSFFHSSEFSLASLLGEAKIKGYFFVAISVFGWAGATVFGKKLIKQGYSEKSLLLGRFFWGLIPLALFWFFFSMIPYGFESSVGSLGLHFYFKVILLMGMSGLLALHFYYQGLKRTPARIATLLELFFPLFAVLINWIFLNQSLNLYQITGGGLLIVSSTILQVKKY